MDEEAKLEWSMAVVGGALRVTYRVINTTDKPIYVCDAVLVDGDKPDTFRRATGRLLVTNGDAPGEVHFILGQASAQAKLYYLYPASFVEVAPGAAHAGEATVPLPLASWHNQARSAPLRDSPRVARLIIHYFSHAPDWTTLAGDDGKPIRVAREYTGGFAMTDPLPLPPP